MIEAVFEAFSILIKALFEAQNDASKQEVALLAAEERISRIRAKAKFG